MVGEVGFEPTMSEDGGFFLNFDPLGILVPQTAGPPLCHLTHILCGIPSNTLTLGIRDNHDYNRSVIHYSLCSGANRYIVIYL